MSNIFWKFCSIMSCRRSLKFPWFCLITIKIWINGQTSITALGWTSVTAQFYLQSKGKYILEAWGHSDPKDVKKREALGPILTPLFICFSSPLGLCYVNWASQECCLFCLRSSLWSSDLPLYYFHRLFPSAFFSHCHSGLLFSCSNYLAFPPQEIGGPILWE